MSGIVFSLFFYFHKLFNVVVIVSNANIIGIIAKNILALINVTIFIILFFAGIVIASAIVITKIK